MLRLAAESATVLRRWKGLFRGSMRFPTYSKETARRIRDSTDRVRYATVALAVETIRRDGVPGAFAELGVWRGITSAFIHAAAPERVLYLFDTFSGFPGENKTDNRFQDTSVEAVRRRIGDCSNVQFRVGKFPDTAAGLESEQFAFVMLDLDKHAWTLAGLEFFYPRVARGGYVFAHDFNSPESEFGVSRAVNEFLKGKPERVLEIPDVWGSAVFRKIS